MLPLVYEVERVRDGGSFSARRIIGRQEGRAIFAGYASFNSLSTDPELERADPMPSSVDPETLPSLMKALRRTDDPSTAWDDLDIRWGGPWPPEAKLPLGLPAHNQIWFRSIEPLPADPVLHAAVVGYVSDMAFLTSALLPHGYFMWSPELKVASLDHAFWLHRAVVVDGWLLYDQSSPIISGGRGLTFGSIYTTSGERVASVGQEGTIRRVR
jgi:acyl-CoA thioesterase-2